MPLAPKSNTVDLRELPPPEVFFGRSARMAAIRETFKRIVDTEIPVLIQGESGTGKEIMACMVHGYSQRANFPWVKVPCPAIPLPLIESELFGYEKGAFTGANATKRGRVELAHRGTLFLDEVGSLDLPVQAKLLQFLQDGRFARVGAQDSRQVNTRLVTAASDNLRDQVKNGDFRLDLFFRINAVTIELPPLRHRTVDLPALVAYFAQMHAKALKQSPRPLSREVLRAMEHYSWPGNIRQLENMIRNYVLLGDEDAMMTELVALEWPRRTAALDLSHPVSLKEIVRTATQDMEREIVLQTLQKHGWNRSKTAKWLKISYRSLLYKLEAFQRGAPAGGGQGTQPAGAATGRIPASRTKNAAAGAAKAAGTLALAQGPADTLDADALDSDALDSDALDSSGL